MATRVVSRLRFRMLLTALLSGSATTLGAQAASDGAAALHTAGLRPLSGDKSRQKTVCGAPRDTLSDVTRLWESARVILENSQRNTGEQASVTFFDRRVARDGKVLDAGLDQTRSVSAARPFRSLSPDSVATHGYVIESVDEVSYYAPDASVLLSDAFAESHCFGIQSPPSSRPAEIGLSFRPKGERDGVNEIGGTFWFDRGTLALRQLEFRYTNVPTAYLTARVGGELTFLRVPSGAWTINAWEIRMPQGNIESRLLLNNNGKRTQRQVTVQSLRVAGGKVLVTRE